jgi:hypothetical protein
MKMKRKRLLFRAVNNNIFDLCSLLLYVRTYTHLVGAGYDAIIWHRGRQMIFLAN